MEEYNLPHNNRKGKTKNHLEQKIFEKRNICDSENDESDIIILHMDIKEHLQSLKTLLERKIGADLNKYTFWLQDSQILESHKNLVDQCVKGEGFVQINVQIQTTSQRINIVDVLKPTDAALAALPFENARKFIKTENENESENITFVHNSNNYKANKQVVSNLYLSRKKQEPCVNWISVTKYKKEQARLKIPDDPSIWTAPQVMNWFQWAVRQFNLTGIVLNDWNITGSELCSLTHEEFRLKLPRDPGNIFWMHLQLLKERKLVSMVHKIPKIKEIVDTSNDNHEKLKIMLKHSAGIMACHHVQGRNYSVVSSGYESAPTHVGAIPGNNGQVQLWQFLLEILTDREHRGIIQWVGTNGEFKLIEPERVARLWGKKKNKPAMNYEKLSRALRYYYDGDMLSKVSGKRFAYKFDCDLKFLTGYNAGELSNLVNESYIVDETLLLDNIQPQNDIDVDLS